MRIQQESKDRLAKERGEDIWVEGLAVATETMERQVHKDGWDGPVCGGAVIAVSGVPAPGGAMAMQAELLPELSMRIQQLREDGPGGNARALAAVVLERMQVGSLPGVDPSSLYGLGFISEAFLAAWSEDGPAPAQHPERVEVRFVLMVDRRGLVYTLIRHRDGDVEIGLNDIMDTLPGSKARLPLDGGVFEGLCGLMGLAMTATGATPADPRMN